MQPTISNSGVQVLAWDLDALSYHPADLPPPSDIRELITEAGALPPLPEVTRRLVELQQDPNANVDRLVEIISLDPLAAAQMLRWANSAYYGLRSQVTSVRDAILRALGFETALGLALGLTAIAPLNTPNRGPIGRDALWRQGMLSATLIQRLAAALPIPPRIAPGLLHLAGLCQNIGYLVLGHVATDAFRFASRLIESNPIIDLAVIERFALGADHTQLGLWLFEEWNMPEPLRLSVRHHHNPAYTGQDEILVCLTWLADHLLARSQWGLGPEPAPQDVERVLNRLGLDAAAADHALMTTLASFGQAESAGDL